MDNVVYYLTGTRSTISNFDNLKKREHPFDSEQAKIKIWQPVFAKISDNVILRTFFSKYGSDSRKQRTSFAA